MLANKTFTLGGHTYTIKRDDSILYTEGNAGEHRYSSSVILVAAPPEFTDSVIVGTLVHELIHAVSRTWNLDLDEHCVETLAQGLLQLLDQTVGYTSIVDWVRS